VDVLLLYWGIECITCQNCYNLLLSVLVFYVVDIKCFTSYNWQPFVN